MTEQRTLPFEPARVHARKGDPYTSDQALRAIARNNSLMHCIWWAANEAAKKNWCFNDTWLTNKIETQIKKRQQRNVVARSRGLLVQAGMFREVGTRLYDGRWLMHYEIDPNYKEQR